MNQKELLQGFLEFASLEADSQIMNKYLECIGYKEVNEGKLCEACGNIFYPTRPNQKYCDDRCKWKGWSKKNKRSYTQQKVDGKWKTVWNNKRA